jgi:hypothetical protein
MGDSFTSDQMILMIVDVIGQDPQLENEKFLKVLIEIRTKIGWGRVKQKGDELIDLCTTKENCWANPL